MADEQTSPQAPVASAPPPAVAAAAAAPEPEPDDTDTSAPVEPTRRQVEGRDFRKGLDAEIDALWARAEQGLPLDAEEEPEPAPATAAPKAAEAGPAPVAKAEEPPAPAIDREAIAREERAKIQAEADERERVRQQVEQERQSRANYEAYIGDDGDYAAVNAALRAAQRGDFGPLDALDVTLPNGKKVSQVKADRTTGLTADEAAQLLDTWDQARAYETVMGDRKVAQVLTYWDAQTRAALNDADVDAERVRSFSTPGEQMQAAIETTRARVTDRLTREHTATLAEKDAEIARLTERVTSLTNERGNLTSQRRAATAASPDRPGQPSPSNRGMPSPEEIQSMSADELFKSGTIDRVLRAIPGGMSVRRTG